MKRATIIFIYIIMFIPFAEAKPAHWLKIATLDGNIEFMEAEYINDNFYVTASVLCSFLLSDHGYHTVSNEIFSDSLKVIFVPMSNFSALITGETTEIIQLSAFPIFNNNQLYLPLKETLHLFTSLEIIDAELINDNILLYETPERDLQIINNKPIKVNPKAIPANEDEYYDEFYHLPADLIRKI